VRRGPSAIPNPERSPGFVLSRQELYFAVSCAFVAASDVPANLTRWFGFVNTPARMNTGLPCMLYTLYSAPR